jgi:hypothetical protein
MTHTTLRQWKPGERARALKQARLQTRIAVFECDTLESIKQAERFKAQLENTGYVVETRSIGLDRVQITGRIA